MKPLKLNEFFNYRFLSNLTWSPDGKAAAVTVTTANPEDNGYDQNLWLYRGDGFRQFTALNKESSFIWDDENTILFAGARLASDQRRMETEEITVFNRISIHGGEAVKAFTLPVKAVGIKKLSDGLYLVTASCDAGAPDYYKMSSEERAAVHKVKKANADYEIFDEIPFWYNGSGVINKLRNRLFLFDERTGEMKPTSEPLFNVNSYAVAGDLIVYSGESYQTRRTDRESFYRYWIGDEASQCINDSRSYSECSLFAVENTIVLIGASRARYGECENPYFYTLCPETGEIKVLAETDLYVGNSTNSDCRYGRTRAAKAVGDKLYFISTQRTSSYLYSMDLTGKVELVLEREGSVDDFDLVDDSVLVTGMYDMKLQEIYTYSLADRTMNQVSRFNQEVLEDKYVAEPEPVAFTLNGVELDGWILKPMDYDPDKSYPGILDIHGGPKTLYSPVFVHEMQYWAGKGYFVFFCNPEGSDGRGNDFADIRGKFGTKDYDGIMKFVDEVLARYPQIDPARLGVTGGSYGGFMTNWIIGHTGRFAAAASQRSISNWISFYGTSDIGTSFGPDQVKANIYDDYEKLWRQSPLKYANNVTTPTLFIHSDEDYRCWIPEGMQMYTAIVDRGVEARMCCFKGENHELSRSGKPLHREKRLQEITDWMDKYTCK